MPRKFIVTEIPFLFVTPQKNIVKEGFHPFAFEQFFPLLLVFKNYSFDLLNADCRAALNVALLAIPQGMAYALVSGLPIQYGLLGSAVAAILGCLFSNSRFITLGPTNATSVLLFGVFASLGMINQDGMGTIEAIKILPWILLFSACFLILASMLRVSFMIQFVSRTVITAYVTAAACLIIANQTKHVLGLELDSRDTIATFWQIIYASTKALAGFSTPALIVSGFTALSYIILQYKLKSLPNVAITLILGSVFHFLLQDTIGSVNTLATFDSSLGILSSINFLYLILAEPFFGHQLQFLCSASSKDSPSVNHSRQELVNEFKPIGKPLLLEWAIWAAPFFLACPPRAHLPAPL